MKIRNIILIMVVLAGNAYGRQTKQEHLDSLVAEALALKDDTNKVNMLCKISDLYYTVNPNLGIKYGKKSLELAEKLEWDKGKGLIYQTLALNYTVLGQFDKALENYQNSMKIHNKLGDEYGIAGNLGNIGNIYRTQGDNSKALEYFQRALDKYLVINNRPGIANSLGSIGVIHALGGNYEMALENYHKALEISKKIGDKDIEANFLGNIASVYEEQGNFDLSLENYLKALSIFVGIGDQRQIAYTMTGISSLYNKIGLYCDKNNESYNNNSSRYYYEMSVEYGLKAVKTAREIDLKELLYQIYEILASSHKNLGLYEKSLEYYTQYHTEKEALFNIQKSQEMGRTEARYVYERDQELMKLKKSEEQKRMAQEKLYRDNLQNSTISLVVILLLLSGLILKKGKQNKSVIDALVFITFLLFYGFVLELIRPLVESIAVEIPLLKIIINIGVALLLIPLYKKEIKLRERYRMKAETAS